MIVNAVRARLGGNKQYPKDGSSVAAPMISFAQYLPPSKKAHTPNAAVYVCVSCRDDRNSSIA